MQPMNISPYPEHPILLIDDEDQLLQGASFSLRSSGINNIVTTNDSTTVIDLLKEQQFTAIVLDIMMPNLSGLELLPLIKSQNSGIPIIMMTALNEVTTVVECMQLGAFDYMVKPVDKLRLTTTVQRAIDHAHLQKESTCLTEQLLSGELKHPEAFEGIITRNPKMLNIFRYIDAIAFTTLPVSIHGPTGAGKELFARSVHVASGRTGEFVALNIAGLDDHLFSDTLFGHTKGAFSGATSERQGMVAKAQNGTLFLDEMGDLSLESQVKLLRLLEDKSYYPIGSDSPTHSNARIVVATHVDLGKAQEEGRFRSDLYYRLQNHQVSIPSLMNRKDDIQILVDHFAESAALEFKRSIPTIPPELYTLMQNYTFPGNVRELKMLMFDGISRTTGTTLSLESFREKMNFASAPTIEDSEASNTPPTTLVWPEPLPDLKIMELSLIEAALERSNGNQTIAASLIGMTRSALNKRLTRAKASE